MALEIERKYLVHPEHLPPLENGREFIQGYLCETPEIRFRITDTQTIVTIKQILGPGERHEYEFVPRKGIDADELEHLKTIALWPPLRKIRYKVPFEGQLWEIDIYQDENAGLMTCETELPSRDHPFTLPPWAGEEITSDGRYANIRLTQSPLSKR
ncbi:TPA: adenylate cyclase [Candidatus Sumerlaeota bacterium]|jgi:adenylate cyclase|nr:adenylate cyclase [Candidatus Sumerlaeota bacterium]